MPRSALARLSLLVVAMVAAAPGCSAERPPPASQTSLPPSTTPAPPPPPDPDARTALPADATTVVTGRGAVALAVAASRALFRTAPAVVLAADGDNEGVGRAGTLAVKIGVPVLLVPRDPA